jgi:hypothetical protein
MVGGLFVISGCDASELFGPVEEALNEIALAVEPRRESEALLAVGPVGNVGPDISDGRSLANGGAVVALVAEQGGPVGNGLDQRFSFTSVVDLPTCQSQADRTSISVDKSVEFGRKTAPGTSRAMISRSPFCRSRRVGGRACRWNRSSPTRR